MKKLLCYILALCSIFLVSCGEDKSTSSTTDTNSSSSTDGTEETPCEHQFVFISTTATCTQNGLETYQCILCEEKATVPITTPSHKYNKNKCTVCGDTITDIYFLTAEMRTALCENLTNIAQSTCKEETYLNAKQLIADNEFNLEEAKTEKKNIPYDFVEYNQSGEPAYFVQNPESVKLADAKIQAAEETLEKSKEDFAKVCETWAWSVAISFVEEGKSTNLILNQKLIDIGKEYLATVGKTYNKITDLPTWYSIITNAIKTVVDIDITK